MTNDEPKDPTVSKKTVLFVGLADELAHIPLPEGVETVCVKTGQEAVDQLSLTPFDLIVAEDTVGGPDSLDFFARIAQADPDGLTPVIFLAPKQSGVQPFTYRRHRGGSDVRYLDREGGVHTFFVKDPQAQKGFTVRPIRAELLGAEIARSLHAGNGQEIEGDTQAAPEDLIWEIGFNQDVVARGAEFHVQTEVISAEPVAVSTTVFCGGEALHCEQHKLEGEQATVEAIRHQVESIHATIVGRVHAGEIRS